jgi:hypothetical protein
MEPSMSGEMLKNDPRQATHWKNSKQTDEPWKGPVEKEQKPGGLPPDLEKWQETNTHKVRGSCGIRSLFAPSCSSRPSFSKSKDTEPRTNRCRRPLQRSTNGHVERWNLPYGQHFFIRINCRAGRTAEWRQWQNGSRRA